MPNGAGGFGAQAFATGWRGVALETAPNGDLVSVNPVNFQQPGAGTVTRIVYAPPIPRLPLHRRSRCGPADRGVLGSGSLHRSRVSPAPPRTEWRPQGAGLGAAAAARGWLQLVAAGTAAYEHGTAQVRPAALDEGQPEAKSTAAYAGASASAAGCRPAPSACSCGATDRGATCRSCRSSARRWCGSGNAEAALARRHRARRLVLSSRRAAAPESQQRPGEEREQRHHDRQHGQVRRGAEGSRDVGLAFPLQQLDVRPGRGA